MLRDPNAGEGEDKLGGVPAFSCPSIVLSMKRTEEKGWRLKTRVRWIDRGALASCVCGCARLGRRRGVQCKNCLRSNGDQRSLIGCTKKLRRDRSPKSDPWKRSLALSNDVTRIRIICTHRCTHRKAAPRKCQLLLHMIIPNTNTKYEYNGDLH